MRHHHIPSTLFTRNREKLRLLLKPSSIVIVHSNDIFPTNADGTMAFQQNNDLLYLTGIDQEDTILVLMPDAIDPKQREILFVRETNDHVAIWEGAKLTKDQVREVSGVERVEWSHTFQGMLQQLVPQMDHVYLATNEYVSAHVEVQTRNSRFIIDCRARYPLHRYERLAPLMHRLRITKEPEEIAMIQQACNITGKGFERLLKFIKPGVGEWEIEAELMHEFLRNKSRGFAYLPIIGTGKNACILHYIENDQVCQDGELILLDVAAEYGGWVSDLTRTVPVNGRFTPRQRQVYDAVLRVFRNADELLRPGVVLKEFEIQVKELMERELVDLGLYTAQEAKEQTAEKLLLKKYYPHSTSHHMGLDVHDVYPPHEVVAEGMVFTIEPGIYIREEGFGVRLENDFLIGRDRNIDLMAHIPIEADEIEALMQAQVHSPSKARVLATAAH